jgi:hypothetical protein
MHLKNDKVVMGKLEVITTGYLFLNGAAAMLVGSSTLTMGVGIVGVVIAVSALTFRYIKNHPHHR